MAERFEDQYMDVLQNIEAAIIDTYRQHPELADRHVEKVLEGLIRAYNAEKRDQPVPEQRLADLERTLLDQIKGMCDWRLGRVELQMGDDLDEDEEAEASAAQDSQQKQTLMERLTGKLFRRPAMKDGRAEFPGSAGAYGTHHAGRDHRLPEAHPQIGENLEPARRPAWLPGVH